MFSKGVELIFNLNDPVEKKCYDYLSDLDTVRRTVFISALFKKYYKGEDTTKLEDRLLDIIDNLTKNGKVVSQVQAKEEREIINPLIKKINKPDYLKPSRDSKIKDQSNDPLDKLADEGFE
jgi:hypothetical protein